MDHLVLQPTWTWTTVMAIELCDGGKYFVKLQSFVYLLQLMATKFEGHACVMLGILCKGGILVVHELLHIQAVKQNMRIPSRFKACMLVVEQQRHVAYSLRVLVQMWVHTAIKKQIATCRLPGSRNVDFFWLSCAEVAAYCHEIAASYQLCWEDSI